MAGFDVDVLIAGCGPVGAIQAALLSQKGVSTLVCDRETEVYRLPRAAHFDAEIMRVFQQIGVAGEMWKNSRTIDAYEFINAKGEMLMRFAVPQTTAQGWPASFMFHQPALEEAVRARLAAAPNVEMALGWGLTSFTQDADGVTATLARGEETRSVRARYLIGCDGANSLVRKALDIELFDYGFDEPWLVIDTLMPDETKLKPYGVQLCDPARPTTIMPMSPGRRRWEFMLLPGENPDEIMSDASVAALMAPWMAPGTEIIRKAVYRFHGLVAKEWRKGRVILAGDSAHQTPPFAGQGMCSGIRDAANLAWKLALVLKGEAPDALLDTYQEERDPHVRGLIQLAIARGKVVCMLDPETAAERDAGMLAARQNAPAGDGAVPSSGGFTAGFVHASPRAGEIAPQAAERDEAVGHGAVLFTRRALAEAPFAQHVVAEGPLADWLGDAEAALVRPDKYVFGTGKADDLIAAWDARLH